MASRRWSAGAGALKCIIFAFLLVPTEAGAQGIDRTRTAVAERSIVGEVGRWKAHIAEASARFGIPEEWIRRVMRAETNGWTTLNGQPITSRAGAMGLMQLMPRTWADMRAMHGLGSDPQDPHDNILAGAAYLRAMYERFGYPGLFAAYNAGPKRYAEHLATGRPLPSETVAYVAAVNRIPLRRPAASRKLLSDVFVPLRTSRAHDIDAASPPATPRALFVRLSTTLAATE